MVEDEIDGDHFRSRLALLAELNAFLPKAARGVGAMAELFGEVQFYINLRSVAQKNDDLLVASTMFLALQWFVSDGLPTPTKATPNGTRTAVSSAEYDWFEQFFEGSLALSPEQNSTIASLAKGAAIVTGLITVSKTTPGNTLLPPIIVAALTEGELPRFNFSILSESYIYLRDLLGKDFLLFLKRFHTKISDSNLAEIKLDACPVELIKDSFGLEEDRWDKFHVRVAKLLYEIPASEWPQHFSMGDATYQILSAKINTSGMEFTDTNFRSMLGEFLLSILGGRISPSDSTVNYDLLLDAIDKRFQPDFFRTLRENLKDVSVDTLGIATRSFPKILAQMLSTGDRFTSAEKDNLVRHLLCSAVEGNNLVALEAFQDLGRKKLGDFIRNAADSTKEKLQGAWAVFSQKVNDRDWSRQIGELIHGKTKAKSLFDIIWGIKSGEEEEHEEA
ncbi:MULTISPECIES: hypothetical protein [unclassified Rhizobium]|uniref:hypothetical protein n=1 Tax=unclassified Rhizobium TaxID=2613769 RepID=UPI0021F6BBD6|nr:MULTISPECIES: hypothetical protein [unclassified Rhizobium]MCV9942080.1 hypothetical protein [Rhizobium sp. BT-175]MCW0015956.1 hypothetical protein [Rhizobium sp. BT-226]